MSRASKELWMIDRCDTLYAPRRLQSLCEERGSQFRFFNEATLPDPKSFEGQKPTAIFVCLRDPASLFSRLSAWRLLGVKVLNSPESIAIAADKFESNKIMERAGIPVPKSILLAETSDLEAVARELALPIVVKGFPSGQGKHVRLAGSVKELKKDFLELRQECKGVMAQTLIPSSFGMDIRVLVLNKEILGVGKRVAPQGTFAANVSSGGHLEAFPHSDQVASLALSVARVHGLDFSGVDLLFGPANDFSVCEVNSAPAFFPPFEEVFGVDVGKRILNNLLDRNS